jgi:nucleoside-diphosphate-sugar epimerase
MTKILITGAFGQIGTELCASLRQRHGTEQVLATGRHVPRAAREAGLATAVLDVTDAPAVRDLLERERIDVIYHLAARLSAVGERDPVATWRVNMGGLRNVLEAARGTGIRRVFWPSSIAAFGPGTPRDDVPQDTVMRPTTIYGVTKVAGELLCDYYVHRYGLDVRGVRYPGVISSGAEPGGGTTDYAVEIFYAALEAGRYTAFVREDCRLPMIYMPDCIDAALTLMDAEFDDLEHHNGFNIAAMSFSAGELAAEIRKHVPDFLCDYRPDERQAIADSWPRSLDDSAARREWGWRPRYDLARMTAEMLEKLQARRGAPPHEV